MGNVIWEPATEYCAIVPHREPNNTRCPPGRRPAPITPGHRGATPTGPGGDRW
jgi:hypothetical protein